MRAVLGLLLVLLSPIRAEADSEALGLVLDALNAGDRALAAEAAVTIDDPVALDIIAWRNLRASRGGFEEYQAFLARNADWPGLPLLRARGEASIRSDADPNEVIAYFEPQAPRTGNGVLALARALSAIGNQAAAEAEALRGWTEMTLDSGTVAELRQAFGSVLDEDHHIARLDHLLWEGAEGAAREIYGLVPAGWQTLAEARIALRTRRPGVDALIQAVPDDLRDHPGLAYERFLWRMNRGLWDTAGDLMEARSTSAEALGRPVEWADRRADLARDVMRDGDFTTCYDYAANHHMERDDSYLDFADLEWIAGYCAFRLGNYDTATTHFEAFRDTVFSPISMGRAGYWLGRAHEAAGRSDAAAESYALGAQYQSSFYGQLAAERGRIATDQAFLADEDYGDWQVAEFTASDVFHAGLLLYDAGQMGLAERFLTHLTESLSRQDAGRLGDFALDIGDPHVALGIAKRAAQNGHEIMRAYYPLSDLAEADLPAPTAMVLSIARRESEFDPGVISPAGAIGLMQVMPGTGRDTARDLGLPFSEDRLLSDAEFNARIGARFLADLIDRYDGNLVLVAAAYNAGPRRAAEWVERFGDPRQAEDIVYWIEAIPFSETRNYIMRVTESIAIYEAQLSGELPPSRLAARIAE
ncbi:MAG: lytic transglycosylase domain-containing protein [Pseudomonadota bacterium]